MVDCFQLISNLLGSRGGGYSYYMPDEASFSAVSISSLGRDIKEKFSNFVNRKKGYQLTKTTEDQVAVRFS